MLFIQNFNAESLADSTVSLLAAFVFVAGLALGVAAFVATVFFATTFFAVTFFAGDFLVVTFFAAAFFARAMIDLLSYSVVIITATREK